MTPDDDVGRVALNNESGSLRSAAGWLLPVGFVGIAVLLAMQPRELAIPLGSAAAASTPLSRSDPRLIVGPRRETQSDPPSVAVDGPLGPVPQTCNGCHQIFDSTRRGEATPSFHLDIELRHGMNDRCVNCHDVGNREQLVLRDDRTVGFAESPMLCAQCHGTVFRDWERGTHGKTLGSWRSGSDRQRRLTCAECHDPHSPRYPSFEPLPGPNTLRMGPQGAGAAGIEHSKERRGPLQRGGEHR